MDYKYLNIKDFIFVGYKYEDPSLLRKTKFHKDKKKPGVKRSTIIYLVESIVIFILHLNSNQSVKKMDILQSSTMHYHLAFFQTQGHRHYARAVMILRMGNFLFILQNILVTMLLMRDKKVKHLKIIYDLFLDV